MRLSVEFKLSLFSFLQHPLVTTLRLLQLPVSTSIFFYAALAPAQNVAGSLPAPVLHVVGNILLVISIWLALFHCLTIKHCFFIAIFLSVLAEFAQGFTQSRTVDPLDLLANGIGLVTGAALCLIIEKTAFPR